MPRDIGEGEELMTRICPKVQLPPAALALPWHSVLGEQLSNLQSQEKWFELGLGLV